MARDFDVGSDDPEIARAEVERTRARMSATLDEIEDVLLRKKAEIQDRLDWRARVREKPLQAAGIALGVGLLLGLLTGGRRPQLPASNGRAELWEARARRLLRIAREQEGQIDDLEAELAEIEADADLIEDDDDGDDEHSIPARFAEATRVTTDRVSDFLVEAANVFLERLRNRG
jgi:ElaB/YqjD/DUF883 family membrane-anchored ribosome-binding protein